MANGKSSGPVSIATGRRDKPFGVIGLNQQPILDASRCWNPVSAVTDQIDRDPEKAERETGMPNSNSMTNDKPHREVMQLFLFF
jgi:hypothetical protein